MEITEETSSKIANMGILCALLVVFIHLPRVSGNPVDWFFSRGIGKIAVPFFFVVSGYLLATRMGENDWYRKAVGKRLRTLCLPMAMWSVLFFLWMRLVLPVSANFVAGRYIFEKISFCIDLDTLAKILAIHPFSQPYLGVTWFLRVLFILVLIAPLLRNVVAPWVIFFIWAIHGLVHPDYGVTCTHAIFTLQEGLFSLFGMTYFMVGMYIGLMNLHFTLPRWVGWCCLSVGILFILARGEPNQTVWTRRMTWLYTPILLLGIWVLCPARRLPEWFTKAAFPVYLLHKFVIALFCCLVQDLSVFSYVLLGIGSFAVCVAASCILHKVTPQLAATLFGGR